MAAGITNSAKGVGADPFLPDHPNSVTDCYDLAYLLPNDEAESDRLDLGHEMYLQILGRKLYLAPVKNPQRVIDLGTGTGIWAIDFGKVWFGG